jgi:hypothetical protein
MGWRIGRLTSPFAFTSCGRAFALTEHSLYGLDAQASGHAPNHQFHETHQLTREWTDADLDKVVDNRAGVKDAARDQRKR